jgi:hypothetical protein
VSRITFAALAPCHHSFTGGRRIPDRATNKPEGNAMITKSFAVVVAVLVLGFGSVASAATTHKPARHHSPSSVITPVSFQSNWNVSY